MCVVQFVRDLAARHRGRRWVASSVTCAVVYMCKDERINIFYVCCIVDIVFQHILVLHFSIVYGLIQLFSYIPRI